jgi:SNF2 family DNA or RNA helicase
MILYESDLEHRVIRKDKQGSKWEYSDKQGGRPSGDGWQRVDQRKHPRATKYLWVRPYSFVVQTMRADQRKPMIQKPTDLVSIDPRLGPALDVEVGNLINDFRNQLRKQFEYEKNPFLAGDRIRVSGKDGVFYVKGVNPTNNRIIAVSATDKDKTVSVSYDDATIDNDRGAMPWYFGDTVKIAAGAVDKKEAEGEIIGYDNHSNKVRVQIGTNSFEVFPEAIVGLRGKNGKILETAQKHLEENPNSFASPDAKRVMESLLRASLDGRMQVSVKEVIEDINASSGERLTEGQVRGTFAALSSIFKSGTNESVFYNPVLDRLHIEYGKLPIRLVCNMRDVKNTHKSFGWKNLTSDNMVETYARVGQKVKLPEDMTDQDGQPLREGRIRRIVGNKVEVVSRGTTRMVYMGDITDAAGRELLPDPTDPAAFGSLNKNAFWLLRDREWARDYKPGDIVSVTQLLQDPAGDKMNAGEFAKVIDTTTDGRLLIKTDKGVKLSVSPRQVRQNRKVANLWQLEDRVKLDPTPVYGTMTVIGDKPNEQARLGVGGERKHKFLEMHFDTGDAYQKMEQELFSAIVDNRATMNQTRAIMAMGEDVENRESKTLVPNKTLMDIIRRLYPTASTFMITRDLKRFPNVGSAVPGGPLPTDEGDLTKALRSNIWDTQPVRNTKNVKQYRDYYEPKSLLQPGWYFDDEMGEFRPAPQAKREPVGKFDFLNPFGDNPPANTRTFSPAEIDHMQRHTPVSLRIIIDPTPADIKARYGVVHSIPHVMRELGGHKEPPKGAFHGEDMSWDHRIKVSSDGVNMYVNVGKELMNATSAKFHAPNGQPLTLHQVVTMPITHKYTAWQDKHTKDQFAGMLLQSSLLSYDRVNKRYQARLSNYDEVHEFLSEFFSKDVYDNAAFEEDTDGAFCYRVGDRKLGDVARKYEASYKNQSAKPSPVEADKALGDGFAWKMMGYDGDDATEDEREAFVERDYQRETRDFLLNNPKTLLANDQGTGKSGVILAAIKGRMNQGQVKKALLVVPANLVTTSWPDEVRLWCRDQKMIDAIRKNKRLSPQEREKALQGIEPSLNYQLLTSRTKEEFFDSVLRDGEEPVLGIASYDMAVLHSKELQRAGFDMVVLDEAQNIKSGDTAKRQGSKRSQTIKDMFTDVPYKIAATGTPVENSAEDLHSIVEWLNPSILGPAEQFMQDFVETDYVDTPDGKRPVSVAIKNPVALHERLSGVLKRYTKDYLREREQQKIRDDKLSKGETFDPSLDFGSIAPKYRYPAVTLTPDGKLEYAKIQRPSEHAIDPDLAMPIDLSNPRALDPENPRKYEKYLAAVSEANRHYASLYAGSSRMKDKYGGSLNSKATTMLIRMQQVLNDPSILAQDPAFADNPLFNDPDMPNPKFDRLVKILDEHDRKPLNIDHTVLSYNPLKPISRLNKRENRERALTTRGKTIIFCQTVEAMKSLQRRLEKDPKYRGRLAFYAGTTSIGELSGKSGAGKKQQQAVYNRFKHDPNVDILIANDAAQTGLSIPQADLVVNYEMNWNPQAMEQRVDRAHRMGLGRSNQHRPVTAIDLITARTVEEKKVRAHAFRRELFKAMIEPQEARGGKEERKRRILIDTEKIGKGLAPALHGENPAAIMEDIIRDNPEMSEVLAMSEQRILRMNQAKRAATINKKHNQQRKVGLVSRLFGW